MTRLKSWTEGDAFQKKMGFVSLFFSFAVVLFLLNRKRKRLVLDSIPDFTWWKGLMLVFSGFLGLPIPRFYARNSWMQQMRQLEAV